MPRDELYQAIMLADETDQIGYVRHLCELYLQDYPDDLAILITYANALTSLAQYSVARAVLDHAEATVRKELLHLVIAQRGHLLTAVGDFPGAEKMFMQAHELDPDDATYLIYAGSVAFRSGDIGRAEGLAQKATGCAEGSIDEAWFNLGGYLLSAQRYEEAVDCYVRAIEIDPEYELAKERLNDVQLILRNKGY